MYYISNSHLSVEIVNPLQEQNLLGSRYCTGCYIFQIKNNANQPLLSGPTFPDKPFNTFDGQGAPEVFLSELNEERAMVGEEVEVVGVGSVLRTSDIAPFHVRNNPVVSKFTEWEIWQSDQSITMKTEQVFDKWHLALSRCVTLDNKKVLSETTLTNIGVKEYAMKWFPHPFFPFPKNDQACRFNPKVEVVDNSGYTIDNEGFVTLKKEYAWEKGLYQPLLFDKEKHYTVELIHPLVNSVFVSCSYQPSLLPLWANCRTFSFEPYHEAIIKQNETLHWNIEYNFPFV